MVIKQEYVVHPSKGMAIRFSGVMDIDDLYKSIKSWYNNYKYDYTEKENTQKNKPQGDSLTIKMYGDREVDDYVKFHLEVDMDEILRVKKVGKKYSGEARIIIRGKMIFDYRDDWKAVPFLFYLYNNVILKNKINKFYLVKIYDEMMELNNLIKSKLGLINED